MKIAFIDNGICENTFALPRQIEHYQVMPDLCMRKTLDTPVQRLSHGTLCAAVFNDIYPNNFNPILDISILDNTGRAQINRLITALEWCLANSVKLIHMSLGTTNYYDVKKLNNIIETLVNNQIILVAAVHNKYIRSYPAALPGVFGVRRSKKENGLENGCISLDLCKGLNAENCFVSNFFKPLYTREGIKIETDYSNSLVAPVLTGIIAKYLNENQTADFSNILQHLVNSCSEIKGHATRIEPYIKRSKKNTRKPVIALASEDKELCFDLQQAFAKLDFSVSVISEEDNNTIPIHHYLNNDEKINESFLYTLEYIYNPDIILLCVNKNRLVWPMNWDVIDVFINSKSLHYFMLTQDESFQINSAQEIIQCISSYFQETK